MTKDELRAATQALVAGMKNYISIFAEENEPQPYAPADADRCGEIVDGYLSVLFDTKPTDQEILAQVEITVKALNALNEACGCALIETDERERLCDIIIEAARLCGYHFPDDDEDITYVWREW